MALAMYMEFSGVTKDQYDRTLKELNLGGKLPQGMICHIAGEGESDGNWRVVDVWESQADFDRFYNEKLRNAMEKSGMKLGQPKNFRVHNTMGVPQTTKRT